MPPSAHYRSVGYKGSIDWYQETLAPEIRLTWVAFTGMLFGSIPCTSSVSSRSVDTEP